ncbi:hypothetical protein [Bradyrhizobium barranii]
MSCIKLAFNSGDIVRVGRAALMRRVALKALFTALAFRRVEKERVDWDRNILIFSTAVTVGLVALYVTARQPRAGELFRGNDCDDAMLTDTFDNSSLVEHRRPRARRGTATW